MNLFKNSTVFLTVLPLLSCSTFTNDTGDDEPEDMAEGICVENGKLVDASGEEFIPFGLNDVHVWRDEQHSLNALDNEIKITNANTVRLVTAGKSWHWNNQSSTASQKQNLVLRSIDARLVPMIEIHNGTCVSEFDLPPIDEDGEQRGEMGLKQIVDEWLEEGNLQTLRIFEDKLMLNIANEWGENYEVYLEGYKYAITKLREAGVNNVLVMDAGGNCGQNPNSLLEYGDQLFDHDPLNNIVLSIHLYGFWRTDDQQFTDWKPPFSVEEIFPKLATLKAPVIVGEYGWDPVNGSVNFNPEIMMKISKELGFGWYFWAWSGNSEYHRVVHTQDYTYNDPEDLTNAGQVLVNDPEVGFKHTAKPVADF
ncbi:cellulase family glycosylhydrolase [Rhodohalobacter sp.]|uniref:cellulase family glycosylhydrolase n=1 Tax=Rhodohalobacter sp. TaxID=1974210 RepID=UPI003564615B